MTRQSDATAELVIKFPRNSIPLTRGKEFTIYFKNFIFVDYIQRRKDLVPTYHIEISATSRKYGMSETHKRLSMYDVDIHQTTHTRRYMNFLHTMHRCKLASYEYMLAYKFPTALCTGNERIYPRQLHTNEHSTTDSNRTFSLF